LYYKIWRMTRFFATIKDTLPTTEMVHYLVDTS
jgi:hypothetical protein